MNTLRCAVYTRKSTEEGLDREFNTLDAQREACEAYIKSQMNEGWKLVRQRYDDGGFSGGTLKRPGLEQLLIDIKAGHVNVVVVYKVDRLTRSLTDFAKIVEVFDNAGASFVAVTQHFNTTTSMGRLTLNVLLSFAQFEREVTGERIRDKIAASKRKGMWMGGVPPLGYDLTNRKLLVNEKEANVVRSIFNRYLETEDVAAVRDGLREHNVKSKHWTSRRGLEHGGNDFERGALYRILRNHLYLGKIHHRGNVYEGEHAAIVPLETWEAVQKLLDSKRRRNGSAENNRSQYLLSGILFDTHGNRMQGTFTQKKNRRRYRYYVSAPLLGHGDRQANTLLRIPAQAIEEIVADRARTLLAIPARSAMGHDQIASCFRSIIVHDYRIELGIETGNSHIDMTRIQHDCDSIERKGDDVTLIITALLGRRGAEIEVTARDGKSILTSRIPDQLLLRNLAQAHEWRRALNEGEFRSVHEIAVAAKCDQRYVRKIMRIAYLAPDIVDAIIDGRQPAGLRLNQLTDPKLPLDWGSQKAVLGMTT